MTSPLGKLVIKPIEILCPRWYKFVVHCQLTHNNGFSMDGWCTGGWLGHIINPGYNPLTHTPPHEKPTRLRELAPLQ
jgi:hypothetical protein